MLYPPDPLLTPRQLSVILQASRKAQGLTQSALAAQIGLSQSRVSHLEKHAEALSVEQLLAWCAVLGLELTIGQRNSVATSAGSAADW